MSKNLAKHTSSPKLRHFFHSAGSLSSPQRVVPCGYVSRIPTSFFPQSSVLYGPGFGSSSRSTFLSTVRCGFSCNYGSAAEAMVYEEESASSGSDEVGEILHQMCEQEKDFGFNSGRDGKKMLMKKEQLPGKIIAGISAAKYHALKWRQIKIETEAWEEAAKEYQELLADMCEQKLARNLPYVKSLFLGWFEPLRDAIAADQVECQTREQKPSHALFFNYLPADMMVVITMHKLMGMLMTANGSNGYCCVIQAACQIGEAIEHESMLHKFLENTKKKGAKHQDAVGTDPLRSDDVQEDTLKAKQSDDVQEDTLKAKQEK